MLYGTNTFHIDTGDLDHNPLVGLIPARHLSLIRSLEWVVQPRCRMPAGDDDPQGRLLWRVVRALPITALPGLKKLYIGFGECTTFWDTLDDRYRASDRERYLMYTARI